MNADEIDEYTTFYFLYKYSEYKLNQIRYLNEQRKLNVQRIKNFSLLKEEYVPNEDDQANIGNIISITLQKWDNLAL